MKSTYDEVVNIIVSTLQLEETEINETTNLFDDLEIDSLKIFEIVNQIEEKWKLSLTDYPELLDEMETVESLVVFLEHITGMGE